MSEIGAVWQLGSEMLAAVPAHTMQEDRSRNSDIYINIFRFYEEVGCAGISELWLSYNTVEGNQNTAKRTQQQLSLRMLGRATEKMRIADQ
ncbi:hypothetical protein N0V90_013530 [Kalmusia sp. IMI 367209]|nr:hypothetical protein N0V90_013530 [Kalmusia sp. IMI 367209]